MDNRIEQRCAELGVTQRWLSEQSGIPTSTISEIKAGEREPRVVTAIRIARALNTTVEDSFIVP